MGLAELFWQTSIYSCFTSYTSGIVLTFSNENDLKVVNITGDLAVQQTKETLRSLLEVFFEIPKDGGIIMGLWDLFHFVTYQELINYLF